MSLISITSVEWAQEDSGLEINKSRRHADVQRWTERGRLLVHESGIGRVVPLATIQAINERLEGSQRLRRGKGAVVGAMDKHLAQQAVVSCRTNHAGIGLLVLVDYQPIAGGMHGQYGNVQVAVEGDVLAQVRLGTRIGADTRRCIQLVQVLVQAQPGLLVEGRNFSAIG